MIKVKKGNVKLQGDLVMLMTEFSVATNSMINMMEEMGIDRIKAVKFLDNSYETGKLTEAEREAKIEEFFAKMAEGGKADE